MNYFQPEQVAAIRDALETAPLKWKVLTHLFLITGARRGEIVGLKWDKVDFEQNRVRICNNVVYTSDDGSLRRNSENRYLPALHHTSGGNDAAPAEVQSMAERGKAPVWVNTTRIRALYLRRTMETPFTQIV